MLNVERYSGLALKMLNGERGGGDNSNKRCFGIKPKLSRDSGDFSGNRDTWKFFRETRENSRTLQKKSGHRRKFYFSFLFKIQEDDPNFQDDLS